MAEETIQPDFITKYNPRTNTLVYLPALRIFGELTECHFTDAYPNQETALGVAEEFAEALKKGNDKDADD